MNREQVKALLPVLQAFAEKEKIERHIGNGDWTPTEWVDIRGDYRIVSIAPETHDWTWACKMLAAGKAVRRTTWAINSDRYVINDGVIWVRTDHFPSSIAKILTTDITAEDWVLYGDE